MNLKSSGRQNGRWIAYRVLYTVDDDNQRVIIYSVAHRREAYR